MLLNRVLLVLRNFTTVEDSGATPQERPYSSFLAQDVRLFAFVREVDVTLVSVDRCAPIRLKLAPLGPYDVLLAILDGWWRLHRFSLNDCTSHFLQVR